MTSGTIEASKRALRNTLRRTLSLISSSEIQFQSGLVCAHVTSHPAFRKARVVCCYLSMPSGEVDTRQIIHSILGAGKVLFVPRIDHERGEIDMLRIYDEQDLNTLSIGTWGIPEPGLERNGRRRQNVMDPGGPTLDLVLLPGMAFDATMSRIGHGKGYYDRFLSSYQSSIDGHHDPAVSRPTLLGLSLTQQILDPSLGPIPITNHDWKVDGVFHPRGLIVKG